MRPSLPLAVLLASLPAAAQTTALVSSSSAGVQSDGTSLYPELSADLRWLAWQSAGSTLVPGDLNGKVDVFVREIATGAVELVSVDSAGLQGDEDSLEPEISADGRFVVYFSYATNLVPADTNGKPDIFLRDRLLGTTELVSVSWTGGPCDGGNRYPTISHDGRFVAWESTATDLVPGDTNGLRDVFVRDRQLGTTTRASVSSAGAEGDQDSSDANIAPDGSAVAFESAATNLVSADTNGVTDVFVRQLAAGSTVRASVSALGAQSFQACSDPYLSGDGLRVAFDSLGATLVPGDTNGQIDVFVKDLVSGAIDRCSVDSAGVEADWDCYDPVLTPDARWVVFFTLAGNLVPNDTNGIEDIYLHDRATGITGRVSVGDAGQQGDGVCFYPALSADGRFVAFDSDSTNLVAGDANGQRDIFFRDRLGSFQSMCAGDGSLATACPCANTGAAGRGCDNSLGAGGALLEARGSTLPDSVRLDAGGELATSLSIFLQGSALVVGGTVFGDGVRCAGGSLKRLYVRNASGGAVSAPVAGDPSIHVRSAQLGDTIPPGATRWYQVYYRDPNPGFCPGATFNVTNGVRVGW